MKIIFFVLAFVPIVVVAQENFPDSLSWKIELQGFNDAKSPKFRSDMPPEGKSFIIYGNPNQLSSINKIINEKVKEYDPEEHVAVKMTFATTNVVLRDTMKAAKVKKFFNKHSILVSDCEVFDYRPPVWTSPFQSNNQTGLQADIDTKEKIEGNGSLKLKGKKYPDKDYVCSLSRWLQTHSNSYQSDINIPDATPENFWIFLYVFGRGDSTTYLNLMVRESGSEGGFNTDAYDYYEYNLPLNFAGWKQIALKYSDITPVASNNYVNSNQKLGQYGDHIRNIKYIQKIQYTFDSKTDDKVVEMNIDNLMILYNK